MSLSSHGPRETKCAGGFTYAEILVAIVLISASLVPAMESLTNSSLSLSSIEQQLGEYNALRSTMEEVLVEPFNLLKDAATAAAGAGVASSYSDSPGTTDRALVYLSLYDGDNADGDDDGFTGTDTNLLWIKVEIESTPYSLEALTQY